MHFDKPEPKQPYLDDEDEDEDEDECDTPKKKKEDKTPVETLLHRSFLEQRKIFLWGAVTDAVCKDITTRLLFLDNKDPGKPITFFMNTPGGSITAGMAVYDTMKLISSPVKVIVTGMAASMGSILLSAPAKGNRLLYPHARVLIHQPLIMGQIVAPAVDINIQALEMEKMREELNGILAAASGQPLERIQRDTDRDFYMTADEAIEYGLADRIVKNVNDF